MTTGQRSFGPGALWGNDRGLPNPDGHWSPAAASKKDFTTENTENHGGPRGENLPSVAGAGGIIAQPDLPFSLLRGPPWFSVFSVVQPCLLALARTRRFPVYRPSDLRGRNQPICLGMRA